MKSLFGRRFFSSLGTFFTLFFAFLFSLHFLLFPGCRAEDGQNREVDIGRNLDSFVLRKVFNVKRVANFKVGDIDGDVLGNLIGQAEDFQLPANDLQHTPHLNAGALAGGDHGNHDFDLLIHAHFIKVQVKHGPGQGMLLQLFDHDVADGIGPFNFQFQQFLRNGAGFENGLQFQPVDGQLDRFGFGAV
jgi:hypothetical protein